MNNRLADAARWYQYLGEHYPDKPLLDGQPESLPRQLTLRDYAVACVQEDITDGSPARVKSAVAGLLNHAYVNLVLGDDDYAAGYKRLAQDVWESYESHLPPARIEALSLGPFGSIDQYVLDQLLHPEQGMPPEYQAVLRTKLGLPALTAPTNAAPATAPTNTVPASAVSTNTAN